MFELFSKSLHTDGYQWKDYKDYFHQMEAPAKTILLHEGKISKKMFFIEKGSLRVWFNNDGKELTCQFFFENEMVGSIESFRKNIPSPVTIETIEPSVLWWIYKRDFDKMMEAIKVVPQLRDKFIDSIFERTFVYMKYFFSTIKDSPQERYMNLMTERPEIVKRVPQHYIASYLGISSVHLSRIKSKIAKENK
ncbi:Crp/Fnr family transcriptional regulator [Rhizosphaericola mali]|uniref:Crp/Fnr family transcriptional regulator n=1 Tax=Rhizosphaericola mali TaxID=2545455 RepID=A0A5P2FYI4_9BACT|nr:Crp/Fnr family transcriptional regulator [Rhizosphaericola mali]QES88566.1 Crp/Fnr family transcriptional regulator [Rhizosphaericola mali]